MKELSIEEKAKRYDEAIEKSRSLHDDYDTVSTLINIKEELENIFPELKESEDEMIRKALIHLINDQYGFLTAINGISVKDILAWLEAQGQVKDSAISKHENKTCKENSNSLTQETNYAKE